MVKRLLGGLFLGTVTVIPGASIHSRLEGGAAPLRVAFPMRVLSQSEWLVDPGALSTVSQYYLVENLASGLLRDDSNEPSGFRPLIAKRWRRIDSSTWAFTLDSEYRWSDGSLVTPSQVVEHFNYLKNRSSRHLICLRSLEKVGYQDEELRLHFREPISDSILGELSLADAVVLHPRHRGRDYDVTSGPYSVDSLSNGKLRLKANPYSKLVRLDSPVLVELDWPGTDPDLRSSFLRGGYDLVSINTRTFSRNFQEENWTRGHVLRGHSNMVHYFAFNPFHPLAHQVEFRREIAGILREFRGEFPLPPSLTLEEQLFPLGYSGRLSSIHLDEKSGMSLKGRGFSMGVKDFYLELPGFQEKLAEVFQRRGAHIRFEAPRERGRDQFGMILSFKGNQKDTMSSLSFLMMPPGPLSGFDSDLEESVVRATSLQQEERKSAVLKEIHRKILETPLAVPLFSEGTKVFYGSNINLDRWNIFDVRLRLYDVQMN